MNTFILMWNPRISSFKKEEFEELIASEGWAELNWSVWDYKEAEIGDRFFMVRVGEGNTGIVMAGTFDSSSWQGEDWSGKGREVYYVDLNIGTIIDSDKTAFITTEELTKVIPEFDWTGGHSGQLVSQNIAIKLEKLWNQYLYKHQNIFNGEDAYSNEMDNVDAVNDILAQDLKTTKGNTCEICGYNYKKIWEENCEEENNYYIFWTNDESGLQDNVMNHIHCLCESCYQVSTEKLRKRLGEPPYLWDEDEDEDEDK